MMMMMMMMIMMIMMMLMTISFARLKEYRQNMHFPFRFIPQFQGCGQLSAGAMVDGDRSAI